MPRTFDQHGMIRTCFLFMSLLSCWVGCGIGEAPVAEARLKSSNQMKELILTMRIYRDVHGRWPGTITEIESLLTETSLDELMSNPVTGDVPGYEYVKPADNADLRSTVILYQVRDGRRANDLRIGYADGRVAEADSTK